MVDMLKREEDTSLVIRFVKCILDSNQSSGVRVSISGEIIKGILALIRSFRLISSRIGILCCRTCFGQQYLAKMYVWLSEIGYTRVTFKGYQLIEAQA